MSDRPALNPASGGTEPARALFSAKPTPEELQRWSAVVFQSFSKNGKLHNFREDLALVASRSLNILYHPLWFIKNRVLSGYICREDGHKVGENFGFDDGRGLYDLMILNAAVTVLQGMQEKNEQTLLIVPVHVKTLCEKRTRELFAYYCQTHAQQVKRGLVFLLQGIEDSKLMPSDLEHIQSAVSFCRAFILETSSDNTNLARYAAKIKIHACGFSLDKYKGSEKQLFERLNEYAEACEKLGIKALVSGVGKVSILSAAIAAGITYLEGTAISEAVKTPRHVEFLGIDSVYKHIFPEQ